MKTLNILRTTFGLKNTEDLGNRFSPIELKNIQDAMIDYAADKCKEQRKICQFDYEAAHDNQSNFDDSLAIMYDTKQLMDSESPDFD